MKKLLFLSTLLLVSISCNTSKTISKPTVDAFTKLTSVAKKIDGFFSMYWNDDKGKLFLEVDKLEKEFLYLNYLAHGLGSNDIGLDRGQIGGNRLVKFIKAGNKILLMQPNLKFRGSSSNQEEVQSIKEAFASAVIGGFPIAAKKGSNFLIDVTSFLMRDAHGVVTRLSSNKQGSFKLDKNRSALVADAILGFPKNCEVEALLTFAGEPKGRYLRSVIPDGNSFTLRTHHSFVELPDDNYTPRKFDPRSGYYSMDFSDYSSPIGTPLEQKYITRHRLKKETPGAEKSKAIEPIIYYLDRGTPEPVKTALLEGASWWNQAFEAAGYIDAFQIKMLPANAHMLDVRYNVIQWVHRSTRGWSYGSSIRDPRTGEILKGHVSLGSLRVRQDFLIAQGLVEAYQDGKPVDPKLLQMSLARLRQLSAHEVGHTLGLAHNFAASVDGRTSVMDYPYPFLSLNDAGELDITAAYNDGVIGDWDKRTILYGYGEFDNEQEGLANVLKKNAEMGLSYISDRDARPFSGAHPDAYLWDNGTSPIQELNRLLKLREKSMANLSLNNLAPGMPTASLEEVLVPVYYAHRFQLEAVAKLIGGVDYEYSVNDGSAKGPTAVDAKIQVDAVESLVAALNEKALIIPSNVLDLIPPKPMGYSRSRESFPSKTGPVLDPMAAAQGLVDQIFKLVLNPERLNRIYLQKANGTSTLTITSLVDRLWNANKANSPMVDLVKHRMSDHLLTALQSKNLHVNTAAELMQSVNIIRGQLSTGNSQEAYLAYKIDNFLKAPMKWEASPSINMPDGSPIGTTLCTH